MRYRGIGRGRVTIRVPVDRHRATIVGHAARSKAAQEIFRMNAAATGWIGRSIERVEDAALLTGGGRYIDDLPVRRGTLHAAILRSPHPHAKILAIRAAAAAAARGVGAVVTGADVVANGASLVVGVKAPIECWPIAVDRVRYVGEPV